MFQASTPSQVNPPFDGVIPIENMTKSPRHPPLQALVADDDPTSKRRLSRSLTSLWPELTIIEADHGVDAWDHFLEYEPDLCFLDVRMPGLTGIEVARRIAGRSQIVFLCAPKDRALAALEAGAVPYLVKPLEATRIAEVVDRLRMDLTPRPRPLLPSLRQLLDLLAGQLRRPAPLEAIETGNSPRTEWLMVDDIVYFEADSHGTRVVSKHGEAMARTPLKELVAQLDTHRFTQINRFAVVNQQHIQDTRRLDDDTMVLSLREQPRTLPVSRHFQALFDDGLAGLANG